MDLFSASSSPTKAAVQNLEADPTSMAAPTEEKQACSTSLIYSGSISIARRLLLWVWKFEVAWTAGQCGMLVRQE